MATVNSKMTALADEVRALSGTTTAKSIDAMTTDVNAANTEITEQTDLIAQIVTALEGKASGGVELPSLSNPAGAADILNGKEAIDKDGNKITGTIATKTSSNLTASGATVTAPAGYYASNATKTIASGSAKTPATTITKNPTISVNSSGLITASVSGTQNVTPTVTAGYVSSGTAGTITVSGSATKQLTTQAAKTITPTTSNQTAVASGRYTTGAVTVKGDANLLPANIKKGVSIFNVAGAYEGSGTTPSGTINITENGTYDVAQYASANVNVAGSGGGSAEYCSMEITVDAPVMTELTIYHVNQQGQPDSMNILFGASLNVMTNTILVVVNGSSMDSVSGGAEILHYNYGHAIVKVTGDFTYTRNG